MCPSIKNIVDLFDCGTRLIAGSFIPFLFALALVMFIWGIVNFFIIGAGEEAKRTQGKQFMLWGIIAFVVITSVWALVSMLAGTFSLSGYTHVFPSAKYPGLKSSTSTTTSNTGGTNTGNGGSTTGTGNGGGVIKPPIIRPPVLECVDPDTGNLGICPPLTFP